MFQNYLAGQLDVFLPTTICFAPFVNLYKRYQPDSFAGSTRAWASTTGPSVAGDQQRCQTCRVENCLGGADLNPHVAFASCIGWGSEACAKSLPCRRRSKAMSTRWRMSRSCRRLCESVSGGRGSSRVARNLQAGFHRQSHSLREARERRRAPALSGNGLPGGSRGS